MQREINIIITDTHFGIKNGSQKWLDNQLNGMDEIYNYILNVKNDYETVNLIHCGDVFDNRSNINTYILKSVRDVLYKLAGVVDKFYILAGNHDYYSPKETFKDINSIDLLLQHPNMVLVTDRPLMSKNEQIRKCFVPWYEFKNINEIIENNSPDIVFTHEDLFGFKNEHNSTIVAGHIHVPATYGKAKNICSTFAMNFADANQERGFYTFDGKLDFHSLKNIIKFYSKNADDVDFFNCENLNTNDYIRIHIDNEKILMDDYIEMIRKYREVCENVFIFIFNKDTKLSEEYEFGTKNIDELITEIIPEHLKQAFEKIKEISMKN